jgi:hypothetical protein
MPASPENPLTQLEAARAIGLRMQVDPLLVASSFTLVHHRSDRHRGGNKAEGELEVQRHRL